MDPGVEQTYYNLGTISQMAHNNQEAINYFKKAIELNPKYFEALFNLGTALY